MPFMTVRPREPVSMGKSCFCLLFEFCHSLVIRAKNDHQKDVPRRDWIHASLSRSLSVTKIHFRFKVSSANAGICSPGDALNPWTFPTAAVVGNIDRTVVRSTEPRGTSGWPGL